MVKGQQSQARVARGGTRGAGRLPERGVERVAADGTRSVRSQVCLRGQQPVHEGQTTPRPRRVDRTVKGEPSFREGARLVGHQHIHVAEVLDAHQALDEDFSSGELTRTRGQTRADHGREELRCQSHRDGQ